MSTRMVECLNNIKLQLVDGFCTESNKTRYLRNAVLDKKQAIALLKNISTDQYNFYKLVMALSEIIQFEREIEKVSTSSKTYYGQLTTYHRDVRKI